MNGEKLCPYYVNNLFLDHKDATIWGAPTKFAIKNTQNFLLQSLFQQNTKGRLSNHICVKYFSQLSFDSEVYTKSAAVADFVYTSESNESCEKHSTQRW